MSSLDPANIDTLEMLEILEVRNIEESGDEIRFSCPYPGHSGGDENPSCYMNVETTKFFCHGCKEKGDAINFTGYMLGISPIEAIRMLKQRYQPGFINPEARSMREEVRKILQPEPEQEVVQPELDESALEKFAVDWERVERSLKVGEETPNAMSYMIRERGFDPEVLESWEFGYDWLSDRATFAVRDEEGTLVGFKARTWDKNRQPKYLILGDKPDRCPKYHWPCYHNSRVVYGLHRVQGTDLIICEGELNVVALSQMGFDNAVAVNGSNFTDTQAMLIRSKAESAVVFFDSDNAGDQGTEVVIEGLKDFMPVRVVPDHERDPASMDESEISDLLARAQPCTLRKIRAKIAAEG